MKVSRSNLLNSLNNNICEIRFTRRRPTKNKPSTRRMLCTNNVNFLNTVEGKTVLNFTGVRGGPRYNTAEKNTIITWDIFMQDWRTINCDSVDLIQSWKADNSFWDVFVENFAPLSQNEKITFMNS